MVDVTFFARQAELSNGSGNTWAWILVALSSVFVVAASTAVSLSLYDRRKKLLDALPNPELEDAPESVRGFGNPMWQRTVDPVDRKRRTGPAGIFISYRRQDEPNFAGRLYDRLVMHFGKENVFMDVNSIVEVVNRSLLQCKILIVIIGKNWLKIANSQGQVRLKDTNDYVRLEIETALSRNIRVIPVLVEGAFAPKSEELPSSITPLARRNGVEMSHAHFTSQAEDLIDTLKHVLEAPDW
jgi:hypothetical protein